MTGISFRILEGLTGLILGWAWSEGEPVTVADEVTFSLAGEDQTHGH